MIYFIDFEDSFTYNLVSFFSSYNEVSLHHYSNVDFVYNNITRNDVLVLGPGPGHVDEYLNHIKHLLEYASSLGAFKIGVCLGHQLIHYCLNSCAIIRCSQPLHGQKVKIDFFEGVVQRYNSWCVDFKSLDKKNCLFDETGELAYYFDGVNTLTMQFHPESVGTSFPEQFFGPLESFLSYSIVDECNNAVWNL